MVSVIRKVNDLMKEFFFRATIYEVSINAMKSDCITQDTTILD